MASEIS